MDGNRTMIITLALALATACTQDVLQTREAQEISFHAVTLTAEETRGIVRGSTLWDDETGGRTLCLSSYLYAQSGRDMAYFRGEGFAYRDGAWRHDPAVYWPMGGRLDFLGYSAAAPFDEEAVVWGANNPALRMRITVDEDRIYDDILYGALWGQGSSDNSVSLPMQHSQAWIEFRARKGEGAAFTATLDSVVLERAYLGGVLNVENNYGNPVHAWDFRKFTARRVKVADRDSVCGREMGGESAALSMLLPEQEMCPVIIHWKRDGNEAVNVIDLPHANWLAGHHYIYELRFGGDEAGNMILIENDNPLRPGTTARTTGMPREERF